MGLGFLVGLLVGSVCGVWLDVSGHCVAVVAFPSFWGGGGGGGEGFRFLSGFPWLWWGMSCWLGVYGGFFFLDN